MGEEPGSLTKMKMKGWCDTRTLYPSAQEAEVTGSSYLASQSSNPVSFRFNKNPVSKESGKVIKEDSYIKLCPPHTQGHMDVNVNVCMSIQIHNVPKEFNKYKRLLGI